MRMNDTQRQEVALIPDTMLRNFVIKSSTPPSPLMETVYNKTMERVPYEQVRPATQGIAQREFTLRPMAPSHSVGMLRVWP